MINEEIKKIYFSSIPVKIFSGGILLTLISCILTWISIEGLALFFATDIIKLITNLKTITVGVAILSALWVWAGLFLTQKNIRFVSVSSALLILIFFYMAYSIFESESVNPKEKTSSMIVLILYGLLYIIPILMAVKNNFKCLYMNVNLTLFFVFLCQLYIMIKFSDTAVKAIGINLQYTFHIGVTGVLTALVCSIILTVKMKKDTHTAEKTETQHSEDNNSHILP
jgi:hypothetical protein